MSESLSTRVRGAAVAAWQAIVLMAVAVAVIWLLWLGMLHLKPSWILPLWGGGDLTWETVQSLVLMFFAVFKLIMFTGILVALWLTLWARQLRKAQA